MLDTPPTNPTARRCWTREEFALAAERGIFKPEERLELIEGDIYPKMCPQNSPHAVTIRLVEIALNRIFTTGFDVRGQLPLALGARSQPEPDVAVVEGSVRDDETAHPTTAVLVVEVADATLAQDRTMKASLYALAGIPEYWIVNLIDRVVEVYRQPAPMADQSFGHHYRSITRHTETESFAPLTTPEGVISVTDLLPRPTN